ncbi:diguanylate cyclase [Candidatus Peregrinibacteria bacterium]|nr:diguanylate cyclase [Candidatus Peregrinibacteria bacterium]
MSFNANLVLGDSSNTDKFLSEETSSCLNDYIRNNPEISENLFFLEDGEVDEEMIEVILLNVREKVFELLDQKSSAYENIVWRMEDKKMARDIVLALISLDINREIEVACKNALNEIRIDQLEQEATIDPLTGAVNRRAFDMILRQYLARIYSDYHNGGSPLSIVMIDLDDFKGVNDKYGHDCGDQVLREFSQRCKSILRDTDVFVRYGGEEFIVLLPEITGKKACFVAHKLREELMSSPFSILFNGDERRSMQKVDVSATMGVSEFRGIERTGKKVKNTDPEGKIMIENADRQLYIGKGERADERGVTRARKGNVFYNNYLISLDAAEKWSREDADFYRRGRRNI